MSCTGYHLGRDVKLLCFSRSWRSGNINTVVFALLLLQNPAVFTPRAHYSTTLNLEYHYEVRSCYRIHFCTRLDPR